MSMTIQAVIDTILQAIPNHDDPNTVDTLKSGDPKLPCRGIVTTFMATRQVLARARELGASLVITHEPTYYEHRDDQQYLKGDPVFESKRCFIQESGMAIWRFHDFWHRHKPDGIQTGLAKALGWEKHQDPGNQLLCTIPPTSLRDLASTFRKALKTGPMRVTGDPKMSCTRVAFSLGCAGWSHQRQLLQQADVLVIGEGREWETCEYVRDSVSTDRPRGLITLGHCNSEEPGMSYLAEWLRPRVPGIPVTFVPAGDPFWYV